MVSDRNLDIIVYGATGFTGRLVCKHLSETYLRDQPDGRIRLGIGGRCEQRLKDLKAQLSLDDQVESFVADSFDGVALREMCRRTKVLIALVGPYNVYGDELIKSCVESRTHYLDLSGESFWVKRQISRLDFMAKSSGTMIVPTCGFDSVPADLNVMVSVKLLKKTLGSEKALVGSVTSGVRVKGGISGGTFASLIETFDQGLKSLIESTSPYHLSPVKGKKTDPSSLVKREPGLVGGFFIMSPINGAVVRRTWGLLESSRRSKSEDGEELSYGDEFSYDEFVITRNYFQALVISVVFKFFGLILIFRGFRVLLKRFGPQSGTGPDEKTIRSGWFEYITTAHSVDDTVQVRVTMKGTKDPGYGWTAICIAESALALVKNRDKLPGFAKSGGFLTPATGIGEVLLSRLEDLKVLKITKEVIKDR